MQPKSQKFDYLVVQSIVMTIVHFCMLRKHRPQNSDEDEEAQKKLDKFVLTSPSSSADIDIIRAPVPLVLLCRLMTKNVGSKTAAREMGESFSFEPRSRLNILEQVACALKKFWVFFYMLLCLFFLEIPKHENIVGEYKSTFIGTF
jgi:hypothetical protein